MQRILQVRATSARRSPVPVVLVGLGPIGLEVGRMTLARRDLFEVAGGVDRAPHLAGRDLAEVLGAGAPRRRILSDVRRLPRAGGIAFHTIGSHLEDVTASIVALLGRGYHVVSSSEELSYPALRAPALARRIDAAARRARRSVVAAGINPGFAMDVWPLVLSSNMQVLERVAVRRIVDASTRREPLQRKIGSGMTRREFDALARVGRIGHVGLVESVAHIAAALGWRLTTVRETLVPKIATRRIRTPYFEVAAGRVCGIHHRAEGFERRTPRVDLDLHMGLGAENPRDEVRLDGAPPLQCVVPGGFHGDRTTVAQLLAAAARIERMPPGLHLPSDLPAPRWAASAARLELR